MTIRLQPWIFVSKIQKAICAFADFQRLNSVRQTIMGVPGEQPAAALIRNCLTPEVTRAAHRGRVGEPVLIFRRPGEAASPANIAGTLDSSHPMFHIRRQTAKDSKWKSNDRWDPREKGVTLCIAT
jgi:hypothetical protein